MIDIRPIRESEADDFLRLLCQVFELDFERAYSVFYEEPYYDPATKWALFEGPNILSVLTVTPLEFGWGPAIGLAGVATAQARQREGLATLLIQKVVKEYERRGIGSALLFAREVALYERNGFEALDRVIRAPLRTVDFDFYEEMAGETIRENYTAWSLEHPDRLRRDERRWDYWNWHYRFCSRYGDGYLCVEGQMLREAIIYEPEPPLPLPPGSHWFGTTFMADLFELPVHDPVVELYLMGRNVPGIPQMFMTDQF